MDLDKKNIIEKIKIHQEKRFNYILLFVLVFKIKKHNNIIYKNNIII